MAVIEAMVKKIKLRIGEPMPRVRKKLARVGFRKVHAQGRAEEYKRADSADSLIATHDSQNRLTGIGAYGRPVAQRMKA
jgi:hypothetical protein